MNGPAAVVIPTLNEIAHIEGLLDQLLTEPETVVGEVLVADGGSTDGTREAVARVAAAHPRVRLIDNVDRIQAAGMNRAVAAAGRAFNTIVRIDAHALYPSDYVRRLLDALRRTGADSVVVRLETVGQSCFQHAVAVAQNSRAGTGGSAHRMGTVSGFVDHGHHAAFRRRSFEAAGGYDVDFVANEDAELDARIRSGGGRIWFDAAIPITYFPRDTIGGLAKQYFRYGRGRAQTFLKHGERLRVRQMLPPAALIAVTLGLLLAPFVPEALLLPLGYAAGLLTATLGLVVDAGSLCVLLAAPALATMHFAWAAGFLIHVAGHRGRRQTRPPSTPFDIVPVSNRNGEGHA